MKTVLFLFQNIWRATIIQEMIPWELAEFQYLGLESHALVGLHRCQHFLPDIIVLDSALPHMALSQYLSMLTEITDRVAIILYHDSCIEHIADPHIVDEIYDRELTQDMVIQALRRAADALARTQANISSAAEGQRHSDLLDWIEKGTVPGFKPYQLFHLNSQEQLSITLFTYGQESSDKMNVPLLADYVSSRLAQEKNTYFLYDDNHMFILVSSHPEQPKRVLSLLEDTYGQNRFFYITKCISYLSAIPSVFAQAKVIVAQSFFLPENRDLSGAVPQAACTPDEIERSLYELFGSVIKGSQREILHALDVLYMQYLRLSMNFELYQQVRARIETMSAFFFDLCPGRPDRGSSLDARSIVQEVDSIKKQFIDISELIPARIRGLNDYVVRALYILNYHYHENISMSDIAREMNISTPYLSFLFKNELKMGLKDYLISLRIKRAESILRYTDLKVQDIAVKIGIQDVHYFCRLFKRVTGTTPNGFRKSARKGELGC